MDGMTPFAVTEDRQAALRTLPRSRMVDALRRYSLRDSEIVKSLCLELQVTEHEAWAIIFNHDAA